MMTVQKVNLFMTTMRPFVIDIVHRYAGRRPSTFANQCVEFLLKPNVKLSRPHPGNERTADDDDESVADDDAESEMPSVVERVRCRVVRWSRRRLICAFTGWVVQVNPVEWLSCSRWLSPGDVISCKVNQVFHLTAERLNLDGGLHPTSCPLHNWSGRLIDRSILQHLEAGHVVRLCWRGAGTQGAFYFLITSMVPFRGVFSDLYQQHTFWAEPRLAGTEFDLSREAITEVITNWGRNESLKRYEIPGPTAFAVTGAS